MTVRHCRIPATSVAFALLAAVLLAGTLVTACSGAASQASVPSMGPATPAPPPAAVSHPLIVKPPTAPPLASVPAEPSGDGTTITLHTADGAIVIALYNRSAPVAAQNFENLARAGFYDGVGFHRIVPGFMIQGGDPTGTGAGGPGYQFPDEPFAGSYVPGTVAMANAGPNTNGSQFFIVVGPDAAGLPHAYTIFGTVVRGLDVAEAIANGPRGGTQDDQALKPVRIVSTTVNGPPSLPGASGQPAAS